MEIYNYHRPSSDSLVTVHIKCSSPCPTCTSHAPVHELGRVPSLEAVRVSSFEVGRRTLRRNSKRLKRRLAADSGSPTQMGPVYDDSDSITSIHSQIDLHHIGLGFSCRILESILRTWQIGGHERVSPRMNSFTELVELSRALWHYECSPRPFVPFAQDVMMRHFTLQSGRHAQDWIFIAIVFDMREVFGYSSMDLVQLGEVDRLPPEPAGHFQRPYQESVPRYIIKPHEYLWHRNLAYQFVHYAHGNLAHSNPTELIARRLKDRLTEAGFHILLSESDWRNQHFFSSHSPAALLRLFERFLHTSISEAQRRAHPPPTLPRAARFGARRRSAEVRVADDGEISILTTHLEQLEEWRKAHFGEILKNFPALEQRFKSCRSGQLIITSLNAGGPALIEVSGDRGAVEAEA